MHLWPQQTLLRPQQSPAGLQGHLPWHLISVSLASHALPYVLPSTPQTGFHSYKRTLAHCPTSCAVHLRPSRGTR